MAGSGARARLRRPAASLCRAISGGGFAADAAGSGTGGGQPRRKAMDRASPDYGSAHRGKPAGGSTACLFLCDAGGQRFADFGPAVRLLPDYTRDTGAVTVPRGWNLYRQRAWRLGDGPADTYDPFSQCDIGTKNGFNVSGLTFLAPFRLPTVSAPAAPNVNSTWSRVDLVLTTASTTRYRRGSGERNYPS